MSWQARRVWTMEQLRSNLTDGVSSSMSLRKDINICPVITKCVSNFVTA